MTALDERSAWDFAADEFAPRVRRFATPGDLAKHCEPATLQTKALDLIDAAVVRVMDGPVKKQQIAAPPQTGKSQRVSRWTPLWILTCDPRLRIVIVSADAELARRWGRQIKRDLEAHPDLGLNLQPDSQAAGRWETAEGGGIYCTGILAGTTGRPIDVLIIDDPIKDRAAAESATQRERCWEFWENDGGLRARKTILMATRWHKDDLAGRLQEREAGQWELLSIPAIATEPDDALGREIGQEIASANPELHAPGYFRAMARKLSSYVWSSLYQQSPTAGEGNIFKRADWRYWEQLDGNQILVNNHPYSLDDCTKFITMDLATSTKTSADWTVASCWAITITGDVLLLDRRRERVPEIDHAEFLAPLRSRWLGPYDVVYIESRMLGTTLVYAMGQAGVPIGELEADVDKVTRALPAAGLVRQHRMHLPRSAPWLDEWLDECADFPKTAHDDQVDTAGYAARVAIAHWLPAETRSLEEQMGRPAGSGEFVDLMAAKW